MKPRLKAHQLLYALIVQNNSLLYKANDIPFVQALIFGVTRWYFQLDFIAKQLLKSPFRENDQDVYLLLLMAIYELLYMQTPDHVAVNEYVELTKSLKKKWAAAVLNGCLRNFLRNKADILSNAGNNELAHYAHPYWFIKKIKKSWPKQWQSILTENNQHPPMAIRVNSRKISRADYLKKLVGHHMQAFACPYEEDALILQEPCPVSKLPGFSIGEVSVQDCGAQLAVDFLNLKSGQRVLDACAAPGGKAMHCLEREPNLKELVAVEMDSHRLSKMTENLKRLDLNATLICADVTHVDQWWDGEKFDRILLDAPCSATGVIRRHPDIKWLRRESDISSLAETQIKILLALWPLLKKGGRLLYVTCSVLPEENERVIERFLSHQSAVIVPLSLASSGGEGEPELVKIKPQSVARLTHGLQLLPTEQGSDGFYYACLEKSPD